MGLAGKKTTTPTLLTVPGGEEEEARVEEGIKNKEEKHGNVREYMETKRWLLQLKKGNFRAI